MSEPVGTGGAPLVLFGAGRMGGALLKAWLREGSASNPIIQDPKPANWLSALAANGEVQLNVSKPTPADLLVLAVKPQFMAHVLPLAAPWVGKKTLVLSVAAGSTMAHLSAGIGGHKKIIRVMPNTPALVGRGMSVLCAGPGASAEDVSRTSVLFAAVGKTAIIEDECLMDAVTALSGSGPAYVFLLAEAMAAAGVGQGLPGDVALELAMATVAGAGEMMWQGEGAPSELRENVTSPGGTTAAALDVLMGSPGMKELLADAIARATARGKELGG